MPDRTGGVRRVHERRVVGRHRHPEAARGEREAAPLGVGDSATTRREVLGGARARSAAASASRATRPRSRRGMRGMVMVAAAEASEGRPPESNQAGDLARAPGVSGSGPGVKWTGIGEPRPRPARRVHGRARAAIWKDVPDALWNDWHWQQRERVTRLDQLEQVIHVTADERRAAVETDAEFHMGITPYYAALMDPDDPACPIRLQSVPTMGETIVAAADLEDPLAEERDMPVPGHHPPLPGPRPLLHDAQLPGVLPPLHAQAQGGRPDERGGEAADRGLPRVHRSSTPRSATSSSRAATRSRSPTTGSTTSSAGSGPSRTSRSSGSARATS